MATFYSYPQLEALTAEAEKRNNKEALLGSLWSLHLQFSMGEQCWLRKKGSYGVKGRDMGICQTHTYLGCFNQGQEFMGDNYNSPLSLLPCMVFIMFSFWTEEIKNPKTLSCVIQIWKVTFIFQFFLNSNSMTSMGCVFLFKNSTSPSTGPFNFLFHSKCIPRECDKAGPKVDICNR